MSTALPTPVLMIVYKRVSTARRVLEAVRQAKPRRLYIAANAPADQSPDELRKVQETRDLTKEVDWDCQVTTLFRTEHLSAKHSITAGISWFLGLEPEGIILEDDCEVAPSFFGFAAELLEKYRTDESVMQIGASNFQDGRIRGEGDYYFSRFGHIWGWATWARAWRHFDLELKNVSDEQFDEAIREVFPSAAVRAYWATVLGYVRSGRLDTWDYQWMFALWLHQGVAITPNRNLVANLGFGGEATNTTSGANRWANMPVGEVRFPLRHPDSRRADREADDYTLNEFFGGGRLGWKNVIRLKAVSLLSPGLKKKLKRWLKK